MTTHATIALCLDEVNCTITHSHYDGYPQHVGHVLIGHYSSTEAVERLMDAGEIRSFETDGTFDQFDDSQESYVVRIHELENMDGYDYTYLWNGKEWLILTRNTYGSPLTWKSLTEILERTA